MIYNIRNIYKAQGLRIDSINSFPVFSIWFRDFSKLGLGVYGFEDESLEREVVIKLSNVGLVSRSH